jgi:hypothetical protein
LPDARPPWWSTPWTTEATLPWPAIGPDVSGGPIDVDPAGHAYAIPARLCYDHTPKSGGIAAFNAAACYGGY